MICVAKHKLDKITTKLCNMRNEYRYLKAYLRKGGEKGRETYLHEINNTVCVGIYADSFINSEREGGREEGRARLVPSKSCKYAHRK